MTTQHNDNDSTPLPVSPNKDSDNSKSDDDDVVASSESSESSTTDGGSVGNIISGIGKTGFSISVADVITIEAAKRVNANAQKQPTVKKEVEGLDSEIDEEVPFHVTVNGCGTSDTNGTYTLVGFHNDAAKYSKPKEGSETNYIIQRETTTRRLVPCPCRNCKEDVKSWLLLESPPSKQKSSSNRTGHINK